MTTFPKINMTIVKRLSAMRYHLTLTFVAFAALIILTSSSALADNTKCQEGHICWTLPNDKPLFILDKLTQDAGLGRFINMNGKVAIHSDVSGKEYVLAGTKVVIAKQVENQTSSDSPPKTIEEIGIKDRCPGSLVCMSSINDFEIGFLDSMIKDSGLDGFSAVNSSVIMVDDLTIKAGQVVVIDVKNIVFDTKELALEQGTCSESGVKYLEKVPSTGTHKILDLDNDFKARLGKEFSDLNPDIYTSQNSVSDEQYYCYE